MTHTKESLIAFEEKVRQAFLDKRIRAPIHLCSPEQADPLIEIFKGVWPHDYVFCTWRSHFHALLRGIPEEEVFQQILDGRSMFLSSEKHRFYCSAIVAGILPIACGVALGLKRKRAEYEKTPAHAAGMAYGYAGPPYDRCGKHTEKVWVFVGDMCARTGQFYEFLQYCDGHQLPVRVVVEDNGLSTNSPTEKVWGGDTICRMSNVPLTHYKYKRTWPHTGVGTHVTF